MWSRPSTEARIRSLSCGAVLGTLLLAGACSSGPPPAPAPARQVEPAAPPASAPSSAPAPAAVPEPSPEALADFGRAVNSMRAGSTSEAQRQFEQLAADYPQFAGAEINLGILYRKSGELERSEHALRDAVQRNGSSAVAWNELGVTLRLRGEFRDAAQAYQKAIAVDASFAPAYRNLGVLLDLYLGDAPGALAAFERYRELSGEQKPVAGWIAELRHRVGKGAAPSAGGVPANPTGAVPPAAASPPPAQSRAPAPGSAVSANAGE